MLPETDGQPAVENAWAVVVGFNDSAARGKVPSSLPPIDTPERWVIDCLLPWRKAEASDTEPSEALEPQVVPVLLTAIRAISRIRVFVPTDMRPAAECAKLWAAAMDALRVTTKRAPKLLWAPVVERAAATSDSVLVALRRRHEAWAKVTAHGMFERAGATLFKWEEALATGSLVVSVDDVSGIAVDVVKGMKHESRKASISAAYPP